MIDILFCGNIGVQDGLAMGVISIAKHTKQPLNIIVLTMDLTSKNKKYKPMDTTFVAKLEDYIKAVNSESKLTLVYVDELFETYFKNSVNMKNLYSPYAFIRLLADKVEQVPDKVLYLDTDVVACKDISELYNIDMQDYEYAGARDYFGKFFIDSDYINSGVLLLNMKRIRETGLFEKCRDVVNNKKMGFPDQTALNKFVIKKMFIDDKYNSQRKDREKDVIRHFCKSIRFFPVFRTLNVKPYQHTKMHKALKCYKFDDIYSELVKLKETINEEQKDTNILCNR